jgi:hypothetical protein
VCGLRVWFERRREFLRPLMSQSCLGSAESDRFRGTMAHQRAKKLIQMSRRSGRRHLNGLPTASKMPDKSARQGTSVKCQVAGTAHGAPRLRIPSIAILLSIRLLPSSLLSRFSDYLINSIRGTFGFFCFYSYVRREREKRLENAQVMSQPADEEEQGMQRRESRESLMSTKSTLIHFVGF